MFPNQLYNGSRCMPIKPLPSRPVYTEHGHYKAFVFLNTNHTFYLIWLGMSAAVIQIM